MSNGNSPKRIATRVRGPLQFSTDTDSDLKDPGDNIRRKEVVVWILIALLCALQIVAFYMIWLKADGSVASWEIKQSATGRLYESTPSPDRRMIETPVSST
jgi:hypothetical protein